MLSSWQHLVKPGPLQMAMMISAAVSATFFRIKGNGPCFNLISIAILKDCKQNMYVTTSESWSKLIDGDIGGYLRDNESTYRK